MRRADVAIIAIAVRLPATIACAITGVSVARLAKEFAADGRTAALPPGRR